MDALTSAAIQWSVAERALDERGGSGDRYLVKLTPHGALVAVADGLGHGPDAALAAKRAMAILEADAGEPLTVLLQRCHERLRPTRGAALSLAWFDTSDGTMRWLGVGSIDGVLLRAAAATGRQHLVLLGGVVGRQLPPLNVSIVKVAPGDTLILTTDGIRQGFAEQLTGRASVTPLAERILAGYAKGTDDALVVVVRYRGGGRDEPGRMA